MKLLRTLACMMGAVNESVVAQNEYLLAENQILRRQVAGPVRLNDDDRRRLSTLGKRIGKKLLASIATIVSPETILGWHRKLVAKKFDGSKQKRGRGRPRVPAAVEELVLKFARENRSWGQGRIAGALANLGHRVSFRTVGNILKKHGVDPCPTRGQGTPWADFIKSHLSVMAATDFFTAEVLTMKGLVTFYVLFFIELGSRRVHLAGVTPDPEEAWMMQQARNVTMTDLGFLAKSRYLLHDRDPKYSAAFRATLRSGGVKTVRLPARSPNLNAFAERWVQSVKRECLGKLFLFGEGMLRRSVEQYLKHYHGERNHQGKGNAVLAPRLEDRIGAKTGRVRCRQRLGGLLKFYHRSA